MLNPTIGDPTAFQDITLAIERTAAEANISLIDATIDYCLKHDLEIEFLGELIASNPALKAKIAIEANALHMLKGNTDVLPL